MSSELSLSLCIPESGEDACLTFLGLARSAPIVSQFEGYGGSVTYVVTIPDLRESLDLAVRLMSEAVKLPGIRVRIADREVVSVTRFWSALMCYAESVREPDPRAYCVRKSARLSGFSGCPDKTCISHCQFICTRCIGVTRERGAPPIATQLREIARQAEVDWCPNLRLPADGVPGARP